MPATQNHSVRALLALKEGRHGWRATGGKKKKKERVRQTTGDQQPTLATLSSPSIYRSHWIIYKPLPLALCGVIVCVCNREREREGGFAELTTTMLCPAAVSAAAAAVWLLAALGPGLALPAEDNPESDVTLCSHCFHRQTPPQGASAGPPLRLLCHRLPRGQVFATLTKPTCDTAVCSAFHLRHGWTEGEEGEERVVRTHLLWCLKWYHLLLNNGI